MAMNEEQHFRAVSENRCKSLDWEGMEAIHETSFKMGFVLDLDKGTLDVYKNDRRLGTMKSGLVGEYCWFVFFISLNGRADSAFNVSISR